MYTFLLFPYFLSFFLVFNMMLSNALILPVSQLQTLQVMTSQIRVTHRIFNYRLAVEINEKSSLNWRVLI